MTQRKMNRTLKSGETKTYQYWYADYQHLIKCDVCDCMCAKHNISVHVKTEYHKLAVKLRNENTNITNINAAICEYKYNHDVNTSSDEETNYKRKFKTVETYNRVILKDRIRKDLNRNIPNLVNKIMSIDIPTINMHEKLKFLLIKYPTNDLLKSVEYILSDKDKEYIREQLLLNYQNEISNSTMPSTGLTCI
jgi:hypothetical protein